MEASKDLTAKVDSYLLYEQALRVDQCLEEHLPHKALQQDAQAGTNRPQQGPERAQHGGQHGGAAVGRTELLRLRVAARAGLAARAVAHARTAQLEQAVPELVREQARKDL